MSYLLSLKISFLLQYSLQSKISVVVLVQEGVTFKTSHGCYDWCYLSCCDLRWPELQLNQVPDYGSLHDPTSSSTVLFLDPIMQSCHTWPLFPKLQDGVGGPYHKARPDCWFGCTRDSSWWGCPTIFVNGGNSIHPISNICGLHGAQLH